MSGISMVWVRARSGFDPSSFVAGPANVFGNTGRNIVTGPGRIGTDMNLAQIFPIGERFKFELRADAFNLSKRRDQLNNYEQQSQRGKTGSC